jgi:hypothetical protein
MQTGDRVTYLSFGKVERGIIKSISDADHVFVVYNCGGNWDRYFDYTAARTEICDLVAGWAEDAPQNVVEQNEHIAQHTQPVNCPQCGGQGWYADHGEEGPIQVQCAACYGTGNQQASA